VLRSLSQVTLLTTLFSLLEFAHCHSSPSDSGSWHVSLSPKDAALIVSKGWGEYLPFPFLSSLNLRHVVLLYAPRDITEVGIFKEILLAAYENAQTTDEISHGK
jgi:hypothetical protein